MGPRRRGLAAFIAIGIYAAIALPAQEPSPLAAARALDKEIEELNDLPDEARPQAIRSFLVRIRQQPGAYAISLAYNLAISAIEATDRELLQEVTTTLAEAIRKAPVEYKDPFEYRMLARLARYYHMRVSLDDPRYTAALSKLEADDQHRSTADFSLADVEGRKWNLKSLRGKVVLVNFWATWCPPCRREIPDLRVLYDRFQGQGLVILAITDEEVSKVRPFISEQRVRYPVLLDPGQKVRELFRVDGVPQTFVYDREGRLVGQAIDRPSMRGFLDMLARAGLE